MTESHTSVLVVGGGPVGLALSCLLSDQDVDHVLIESHPDTSRHPKARGVSARSMEIFRRLGLEKEVRAAGLPAEQVHFYRGRDLVDPDYVRNGLAQEPGEGPEHTPSPGLICSQDVLEPLLLRRATELAGSRVRFAARLVSFEADGLGVRAVVEDRNTGRLDRLRADCLVGCDGAASTVRTGAGIAMEGPVGLGRYLSIRFEAPWERSSPTAPAPRTSSPSPAGAGSWPSTTTATGSTSTPSAPTPRGTRRTTSSWPTSSVRPQASPTWT